MLDYATGIGVPKFLYCGSFLGQEKQNLLSDDSSSVINEYALKFMESLTKAKESSPGLSLEKVEDIELIDMQVSWADHAHRIQRYQHNFILSQSISLIAESNQMFIQMSIDHIQHKYKAAIGVKWFDAIKNESKITVDRSLKYIEDDLNRVCLVEISRVSKAGGPLPVFKKRAELKRLLCSNDALVVTAQTGSGKVRSNEYCSGCKVV